MLGNHIFSDDSLRDDPNQYFRYMGMILNELGTQLIVIRKLPKTYFRETAKQHAINDQPIPDTHLKKPVEKCPRNMNRASDLLLIYMIVQHKLRDFPEPVTFHEAVQKVGETLRAMTSNGFTTHELSEKLAINYGALKNLHDGRSTRPRECPWALNFDLEHIQKAKEAQATGIARTEMSEELLTGLEAGKDRKLKRLRLKKEFVIYPYDSCASCGAPWSMLDRKGEENDTVIKICTVCDCENLIDTGEGHRLDDANTHEIIETGAACWMCQAENYNLEFTGIDTFRMDVYSCKHCNSTNRIPRTDLGHTPDEEEVTYGNHKR